VKRHFVVLVLGLALVLVLSGRLARAAAGPGPDDPQDSLAAWSPDGAFLSFERTAPRLQHVMTMTAGGKAQYLASFTGILRGYLPGGRNLLIQSGSETLVTPGGRFAPAPVVIHGTDATASPDGARIAYVRGGTLYAAPLEGGGERALASSVAPPASDVTGPVWSPDGSRLAVSSGTSLLLVRADGAGQRTLAAGPAENDNPSWSPDGATIAFEHRTDTGWQIWASGADCEACARALVANPASDDRYPQFSPVANTLAFISDRQHARGGATRYQYALYAQPLAGGAARKLVDDVHPYSPPGWSPTGGALAVAAGRECRRWGIYVVPSSGAARTHRLSNICRFDGTSGADVIRGSQSFDIVNGLGGNDVIHGNGGSDKISGEGGNDVILAGAGNDFVLAGSGDDRVYGGPGNDVVIGGNGRDRIDCGPGNDTVEGAGPLDRIARNCEHVRR
jgi:dipeptidyl aminopeptidase/acylaminoacyl peptidase